MSDGLLFQRSERDIAEACAATFKACVISAHRHLPAEVLATPAVEALLAAWEQQGREEVTKAENIQKRMIQRADEARENFARIARDLHADG